MKNRIREVLSERGMSQKELAQGIGMSEIGLSRALDGSASKATIDKVSKFLGVDASCLIIEGELHKALFEGILSIGDTELEVAVLDDGTRVIRQAAVFRALGRPPRGNSRVINIPTFMDAANLQPYIDEELMEMINKIPYIDFKGIPQEGFNAMILPLVCDLYLRAREAGAIKLPSQLASAAKAEILIRSLAKVSIIALVDEATGYNTEKGRAVDALQQFLNKFMRDDAAKWVKTFNEDFFEMIYRMNGWTWTGATKHPGVVGKWINDIVYERIAPKVLEELRRRNPKNENGNRSHKHHQFLSEEIGHPKLKEHIAGVMAIGRLSGNNWQRFMRNLDRAYPKWYTTPELNLDWDEE